MPSSSSNTAATIVVKSLGLVDYQPTWKAMQDFTLNRDEHSQDEIWLLQHNPVFTQGQAGKAEHILASGDIPVVQVDRGGQVTYHGPGQLIAYILIDIKRNKMGVRNLVTAIENSVVATLKDFGIDAAAKPDAPGVYVNGDKIASLGLRIKKGRSFHGLGFNIDIDLSPFERINPCGYAGLKMVKLSEYVDEKPDFDQVAKQWANHLCQLLDYQQIEFR